MDLAKFNLIVDGYGSGGIAFFGMFGNLVCIFVYSKAEFRKHSVDILILGLSVSDFIISIINIINGILVVLQQSVPYSIYLQAVLVAFETYYPYCFNFAQACSVYHTLGISLERYIAICYPLKTKLLCTTTHSTCLTISIFIFSLLIVLPQLWIYHWVDGETIFDTCLKVQPSEYAKSFGYYVFRRYVLKIVMYILPFVSLIILNTKIMKTLKQSQKGRANLGIEIFFQQGKRSNIRSAPDSTATRTLLCVVICFAICFVPEITTNLYLMISGKGLLFLSTFDPESKKSFLSYMVTVNGFLFTVNSSLNFFIYSIMNRKFRNEIRNLFRLS